MKSPIKAKSKSAIALAVMACALSLVSLQANAGGRSFNYYADNDQYTRGLIRQATAACTTLTTNKPLPTYVCCKLITRTAHHRWHTVWRNTWVSGACMNANRYARHDSTCDINSPVYTTGMPILGNCQFSTIKNKHLYYHRAYYHGYKHKHYYYTGYGYGRYYPSYGLE
jgi:hypothetical protein